MRYTEQDVAALYCGMRDGVCAVQAQSWRLRLLDLLFPERAARRRLQVIAVVYQRWQAARPAQLPAETLPEPVANVGSVLAQQMVRASLRKIASEA